MCHKTLIVFEHDHHYFHFKNEHQYICTEWYVPSSSPSAELCIEFGFPESVYTIQENNKEKNNNNMFHVRSDTRYNKVYFLLLSTIFSDFKIGFSHFQIVYSESFKVTSAGFESSTSLISEVQIRVKKEIFMCA